VPTHAAAEFLAKALILNGGRSLLSSASLGSAWLSGGSTGRRAPRLGEWGDGTSITDRVHGNFYLPSYPGVDLSR
jgi:hypothetical protein